MMSLEIYENEVENMYAELGANNQGIFYIRYSPDGNWYELPAGEEKIGDGLDRERNAWHKFDKVCDFKNSSFLEENNLTKQ